MATPPIRVLQVVGAMNRGGTETWLMHVLRHIDRRDFEFTFLALTDKPSAYDEEILSLNAKIEHIPHPRKLPRFAYRLSSLLHKEQYDIIHSHTHFFSGIALPIAAASGVRGRIAHCHNDTRLADNNSSIARRAYIRAMEHSIRASKTFGIGVSEGASECMFGPDFKSNPSVRILHCGVDMRPFEKTVDKTAFRQELGLPEGARVIGHVGRMERQKNHGHILDVASAVMRANPNTWLLLLGDGPLRSVIKERAQELGILDRTLLLGSRADAPKFFTAAMDAFVFPSFHEGLGLALIEAQAAGLPCVISEAIPAEATVIPESVQRVGLARPLQDWVHAVEAALKTATRDSRTSLRRVAESDFNISRSAEELLRVYRNLRTAPVIT